jgi:hypothetical protein
MPSNHVQLSSATIKVQILEAQKCQIFYFIFFALFLSTQNKIPKRELLFYANISESGDGIKTP